MLKRTLVALVGVQTARAALFSSPAELPANKTYDYIIVGCTFSFLYFSSFTHGVVAGPAGSVLGNRLSEDTNRNVLVIEAGGKYAWLINFLYLKEADAGYKSGWLYQATGARVGILQLK
jgi:hypothetical protein